MEKLLKVTKRLVPTSLFGALQPYYHSSLAALASLWYGFPSRKLSIVGVTGTNGKTTTVTLLYRIATALGYTAGLISTVENIVGKEAMPTEHTTPDPLTLHKLFRHMVDAGCTHVFMEVSSHALDQNRVLGVRFSGGIFSNLTHDHLDYHKTFQNYFDAKKKFFTMLPSGAFALSNTDNDYGTKMLEGILADTYSYGFKGNEAFHGEITNIKRDGLDLTFNGAQVSAKLLGKFNAYNLLATWSACQLLGFDMEKVNAILKDIEPPLGRFEHFTSPGGVLVVVDYAHTPDALENVLKTIRASFVGAKIISVFGCGGDRDPMKRKEMGAIGSRLSDSAIFTSDNPRSEDPEKILAQMKAGVSLADDAKVKIISNRHEAILEAIRLAQTGDIILCAGKGHENYQEIDGVKHHFNDMEEFRNAFGA
ncbi:MAG: UDP-N-acetylmuramoyl-L-alanyl-D-glutamate--2,6-diaminopimelate ligase [Parcubacteria group bacterium]|nr:UDP-N-acetylmuramoyl-L-alanyl-D-glutamate--2,6-diaminopimelate ligase [Parcubacteria group bacterium]